MTDDELKAFALSSGLRVGYVFEDRSELFLGAADTDGVEIGDLRRLVVAAHAAQPPREPLAHAAELARMRARIESLRGLCKSAVGLLHDAGRDADADRVHALIGDMEPANVLAQRRP